MNATSVAPPGWPVKLVSLTPLAMSQTLTTSLPEATASLFPSGLSSAILNRDHPVLLGAFGLITAAVIVSSALADAVQTWLDPRVGSAPKV